MTTAVQSGKTDSASSSSPLRSAEKLEVSDSPLPTQPPPGSPVRPPVSPITPATAFAQLATPLPPNGLPPLDSVDSSPVQDKHRRPGPSKQQRQNNKSTSSQSPRPPPPTKATFIPAPNPTPFDEADNTDAAALRAAIAVLQIQKEKSRRDIKTLQQLKQGLLENPDNFTGELLAGRLREEKDPSDPLHATFAAAPETEDTPSTNEEVESPQAEPDSQLDVDSNHESPAPTSYPPIPAAQNVIRCPPINWAKYHIAGEPLDRMHEEQKRRPNAGEPVRDATLKQQRQQMLLTPNQTSPAAEHHVFAPFEPWRDKPSTPAEQLGLGTQAHRTSK